MRYRGLLDPRLDIYLPMAQSTMRVKHLLIRTTGPVEPVVARVRAIAHELDPGVHVGEVELMSHALARESAPWRFAMRVLGFFGGLAAVLAAVGAWLPNITFLGVVAILAVCSWGHHANDVTQRAARS